MGEASVSETFSGSIFRAKSVLDALASEVDGASLSTVIAKTNFTKTTAHRTLKSLQEINYVSQEPDTRRYHLGSALAKLARDANVSDLGEMAVRSMRRLAEETEDTIFLAAPEGAASVCVGRALGEFPIRTLTIDKGDRTPLGVGATAQALYAMMPEAKRTAICKANKRWMAAFNFTPEIAEERYKDFHKRGYAHNPSIAISGMSAVGLPIVTKNGRLVAALGIGAINERMKLDRIESLLVPTLRKEVDHLSERFTLLEAEGLL